MSDNKEKVTERVKNNVSQAAGASELDLDDLSQVSGGADPFADVKRVTINKIDEDLRNKI